MTTLYISHEKKNCTQILLNILTHQKINMNKNKHKQGTFTNNVKIKKKKKKKKKHKIKYNVFNHQFSQGKMDEDEGIINIL